MARICLRDIHLTFTPRRRGSMSIKDLVLWRSPPPLPPVEALRGLDLDLGDGARLGIIGHNGAGKSTLLRLLAGIYRPTRGERIVEGRISSLFELHLGFNEDATGWENIRYRGFLLRETPRSLEAKIADIAAFTELGEALDRPIRYYSAGMLVRLAFAISTAIEPEVLLVDEVLAAGDLAFQEKARRRMQDLMQKASVLVLVSHSLKTVEQLCDRVLWMENGRARLLGPAVETVAAYRQHMLALAGKAA